jgi:hypothetical protein
VRRLGLFCRIDRTALNPPPARPMRAHIYNVIRRAAVVRWNPALKLYVNRRGAGHGYLFGGSEKTTDLRSRFKLREQCPDLLSTLRYSLRYSHSGPYVGLAKPCSSSFVRTGYLRCVDEFSLCLGAVVIKRNDLLRHPRQIRTPEIVSHHGPSACCIDVRRAALCDRVS